MGMQGQNFLTPDGRADGEPFGPPPLGLVIVRCCGLLYGIDVAWVREIRPFTHATPVYGLPAFWVGLAALRGHLYAVLDLPLFLSPQSVVADEQRQIMFTAVHDFAVGLLVTGIMEVRQPVDPTSITAVSLPEAPYIRGATGDQIPLLDLPTLFADARLAASVSRPEDV